MARNTMFGYAESEFAQLRKRKLFFVDNSWLVRKFEELVSNHILLCRPPRFGKSLMLSMFCHYYDERTSDEEFAELFADLEIGRNPTLSARKYKVLLLNLSPAITCESDAAEVRAMLNSCVNGDIGIFRRRYKMNFELSENNCTRSLQNLYAELTTSDRLLVLIDEYDSTAKTLLQDASVYTSSMRHKLGMLKALFVRLKALQTGAMHIADYRTVTVGISPLPLAELSAWNIVNDVSLSAEFVSALGFTEQHVREALQLLNIDNEEERNSVFELLRDFFDGYRFVGVNAVEAGDSANVVRVFSPQLIIRFCQLYRSQPQFAAMCRDRKNWTPMQVRNFMNNSDPNVLPAESLYGVMEQLPVCTSEFLESFTNQDDTNIDQRTVKWSTIRNGIQPALLSTDAEYLRWYLYFQGLLTVARISALSNAVELTIPNRIVRYDHFLELVKRVHRERSLLGKFWAQPTERSLYELFSWITKHQQTPVQFYHQYIEYAFQDELESALRCMIRLNPNDAIGKLALTCGCYLEAPTPTKPNRRLECDLLLNTNANKIAVCIELKHIKPCDVQLPHFEEGGANAVDVVSLSDEQVLALAIVKGERVYKQAATVDGVLQWAFRQLRKRAEAFRVHGTWHDFTVHLFAVLQVGSRILVRQFAL